MAATLDSRHDGLHPFSKLPSICIQPGSFTLILQDLMPSSLRTVKSWTCEAQQTGLTSWHCYRSHLPMTSFSVEVGLLKWLWIDLTGFAMVLLWSLGQRSVDETCYESIDVGFCYPKDPTYDDHWSDTTLPGSVVFIPSYGRGLPGDSCCSMVVVDV